MGKMVGIVVLNAFHEIVLIFFGIGCKRLFTIISKRIAVSVNRFGGKKVHKLSVQVSKI
jgi:hypothetical protein